MKCNKKRLSSKEDCQVVISKAWSGASGWRGKPLPTRYYKCKECKSWHLTSKPLKSIQQLRREAQARA